ncbi:WecB/TagA/CpsF family glycosyltransferase [Sinomonas atrocyanea]|uniref:WecB/TagA/CpsF family glycosyltransferase n=1 Tax=Sinomonas atrocyanea TaxID=37927 RepID=UPI003D98B0C6
MAVELILETTNSGNAYHVHFGNAYTVYLAGRDQAYAAAFSGRGWLFPDGKPLSWVSRIRNSSEGLTQTRGPSVFRAVLDEGRAAGVRHYFLGASEKTLNLLTKRAEDLFPGVEIVGSYSPPFRPMTSGERAEQDEAILATRPDLVWIGLGTPKQDYEAKRICDELGVTAVAVGAAFDFLAGVKKESPRWVSRIGFEWLHRLITEPKRLWRRYLFGNAGFLRDVVRHANREPAQY